MRRTFGVDVLACPRCGGQLRLVALIEQASVIGRILRHLGLPTDVPEPQPARAPPRRLDLVKKAIKDLGLQPKAKRGVCAYYGKDVLPKVKAGVAK